MLKITALNTNSTSSSDSDFDNPQITKEAQEEITHTKYNKALFYQREGKYNEALYLLKEITEEDLIKLEEKDGLPKKFQSLKYSSYRNIGLLFSKKSLPQDALNFYLDAAEIDGTDVTLWHKIGSLALEVEDFVLAVQAFERGLECNPKHWPCLDKIITILYGIREEVSCLWYISKAFKLNFEYLRGLALRALIYKDNTAIRDYYEKFNPDHVFDPSLDTTFDKKEGDLLIEESEKIAEIVREQIKLKDLELQFVTLPLIQPLDEYTWLSVGKTIITMYNYLLDNEKSLFTPLELNTVLKEIETEVQNEDELKMDVDEENKEIKEEAEEKDLDSYNFCKLILNECIENMKLTEPNQTDQISNTETNTREDIKDAQISESIHDFVNEEIISSVNLDEAPVNEDENKAISTINDCIDNDISELVKITSELEKTAKQAEHETNIEYEMEMQTSENQDDPKDNEDIEKKTDTDNTMDTQETTAKDDGAGESDTCNRTKDKDENDSTKEKDEKELAKSKANLKNANRRRRSSLLMLEPWGWHQLRKSNRAKIGKGTKESRDNTIQGWFKRILSSFLPNGIGSTKDEDSNITTLENKTESSNIHISDCSYFNSEKELTDVKTFWEEFALYFDSSKFGPQCDILTVLEFYIYAVASKWEYVWSEELISIFLEAYEIMRLYIKHPNVLDDDIPTEKLKLDAEVTLFYGELLVDRLLTEKNDKTNENKPLKQFPIQSEAQIGFVSARKGSWGDDFPSYFIRVCYLKALIAVENLQNVDAIDILENLLQQLEIDNCNPDITVFLPNCKNNQIVKIKTAQELLNSLKRRESLSKMIELFDKKAYNELVSIVLEEFDGFNDDNIINTAPSGVDRPVQISMLLESLWYTNNLENCLNYSEKCLDEAFKKCTEYDSDSESETYQRWCLVLLKCLCCIEECIKEEGLFIIDSFEAKYLQRLVENLAQIACYQLESNNGSLRMPFQTVQPWILLHYVLQREEDKGKIKLSLFERKSISGSDEDEDEDDIPPSLMVLFVAHDFLGRQSWCCFNEGELLLFTLDVVMPLLRSPFLNSVREKISQHIEQIFYCLYQHPSKKNNKVRYLVDHNVSPQKLSWERAQQLFEFFKPDITPEFDGYKYGSISAETEGLLKRIVHLIPPENDPQSLYTEVTAFIEGKIEKMPPLRPTLPEKMQNIYYLLGDYYFKNSEFTKAFKNYGLDLCMNPERIDSWAGMALSRASVLETKLNSCESFNDAEFLDKARTVQLCFKQALDISPDHSMLWIEYGAFVYSIHSFCSRLMKTEADTLSMEKFEILETQKESLLKSAKESFISADIIWQQSDDVSEQDERWLHQYMQGKIAEKQAEEPTVYMNHYMKSKELLHDCNCQYPPKINYNNPQTLAVEALEVFYRIHSSILKYIELHEKKTIVNSVGKLFTECLNDCGVSGFITGICKEDEGKKKNQTESTTEIVHNEPRKRSVSESNSEENVKRAKLTTSDHGASGEIEDKCEDQVKDVEKPLEKMDVDDPNNKTGESSSGRVATPNSLTRRGSYESTTTTTTQDQTSGTSSDSSDSSSDDDSSDSSSSSDSESSSEDSDNSPTVTPEKIEQMTKQCIQSLELCICRFPQHYKALYRLAYHYFHRPLESRDLIKCRQLLLGQYTCSGGALIQGLFSERKNNNFFNGVWRIPVSEMDRPGSFASHMSRCIALLMQVLRASSDHRTLLELCLQLKRTPDPDKKYLRESEREQLSQQALSLCLQCIRELLRAISSGKYILTNPVGTNTIVDEPPPTTNNDSNPASTILIDVYRAYQKAQKSLANKESLFAAILIEAYKCYMNGKVSEESNLLEIAIKFCQQRINLSRVQQVQQQSTSSSISSAATVPQQAPTQPIPVKKSVSKPSSSIPSRPRGRPPNSTKTDYMQGLSYNKLNNLANAFNLLNMPPTGRLDLFPFNALSMASMLGNRTETTATTPTTSAFPLMSNDTIESFIRSYNFLNMQMPSFPNLSSFPPSVLQQAIENMNASAQSNLTENLIKQYAQMLTKEMQKTNVPTSTNVPMPPKEPPKSKAPNKDSILKAVYRKDKTTIKKDVPKPPVIESQKKEINMFKDRPYLSVTPVTSTTIPPATSAKPTNKNPVKTLQQKLAERQKQNVPSKINLPATETAPMNFAATSTSVSVSHPHSATPPAAHSSHSKVSFNPNFPPLPAHTSPIKSTNTNIYNISPTSISFLPSPSPPRAEDIAALMNAKPPFAKMPNVSQMANITKMPSVPKTDYGSVATLPKKLQQSVPKKKPPEPVPEIIILDDD